MQFDELGSWATIYNEDYTNVDVGKVNSIITDPLYDLETLDLTRFTDGNILMFCKPENQYGIVADEYSFWIKTPSTKNYSRKCGRFVEMILILRGSKGTFNQLH